MPHVLLGGGLLLLGLLFPPGGPGRVWAQPILRTIDLPVNATYTLRMRNKQAIREARVEKQEVLAADGDPTDASAVILRGRVPGITNVTLRPDKGTEADAETYEVVVQQDIALLKNLIQRAVPTANVIPIPGAGNTIVLTGYVARAEDVDIVVGIARTFTAGGAGAAGLVNAMRVGGVMQVQLDVVVARVARTHLRRLAFDLSQNGQQHLYNHITGGNFVEPTPGGAFSGGGDQPLIIPNLIGGPNGSNANFFLLINTARQSFFIWLQALRDNSLAKLLAEPKLVTMSGRPAEFTSGGQQAVPTVAGLGGTAGVTFQDFGTILNFLPIVLGNGRIFLEVESTVSNLSNDIGTPLPAGGFVAGRLLQRVRTAVEIEDGQTFAICGLIQNRVQANTRKTPVLGDLPYIGAAFCSTRFEEQEEELVVLVTPHLVDPMDCSQVPKCLPGQETRSPDDFELFLEGIMEAPRGSRPVCPGRRYLPAYRHSPTVAKFPCCGPEERGPNFKTLGLGLGSCGANGCMNAGGVDGVPASAPPATPALAPPPSSSALPAAEPNAVPATLRHEGPALPQVVPMSSPAGAAGPPQRLPTTLPPTMEGSDAPH